MSRQSFEEYGLRARVVDDPTQATGRLLMREGAARLILRDVIDKLEIAPTDRLLDIGCGIGQLGIPLRFLVEDYVGIDHPDVVSRFRARLPNDRATLIPGNFLDDLQIEGTFSKILCYDSIHYLGNIKELVTFLRKAMDLLRPRGLMLIGDLPNKHLKHRFFTSDFGKPVDKAWAKEFDDFTPQEQATADLLFQKRDPELLHFDDALNIELLRSLRAAGHNAWLIPQRMPLPMYEQREDVLVEKL